MIPFGIIKAILKLFIKKMDINLENYKKELVSYLLTVEGGLSNDLRDVNAAKFPSPTPNKWHTNKGVTYKVFVENAAKLGYKPTVENFIKMPLDIWLNIKNKLYLIKGKKFTDNQILADYIGLWYWGGWANSYMPSSNVKAVLTSNSSNKDKLKKLVELRKLYFKNLVEKRPNLKVYLKGWTDRANKFYNQFSKYL